MIPKIKEELIGKKIHVYQAKGISSPRYKLSIPTQSKLNWIKVERVIEYVAFDFKKSKHPITIGLSGGFSYINTDLSSILNLIEKKHEIINELFRHKYKIYNHKYE